MENTYELKISVVFIAPNTASNMVREMEGTQSPSWHARILRTEIT
jgi:hypothetical protein